jgi:hypothetical protein
VFERSQASLTPINSQQSLPLCMSIRKESGGVGRRVGRGEAIWLDGLRKQLAKLLQIVIDSIVGGCFCCVIVCIIFDTAFLSYHFLYIICSFCVYLTNHKDWIGFLSHMLVFVLFIFISSVVYIESGGVLVDIRFCMALCLLFVLYFSFFVRKNTLHNLYVT